jgi:hypothetical protein
MVKESGRMLRLAKKRRCSCSERYEDKMATLEEMKFDEEGDMRTLIATDVLADHEFNKSRGLIWNKRRKWRLGDEDYDDDAEDGGEHAGASFEEWIGRLVKKAAYCRRSSHW